MCIHISRRDPRRLVKKSWRTEAMIVCDRYPDMLEALWIQTEVFPDISELARHFATLQYLAKITFVALFHLGRYQDTCIPQPADDEIERKIATDHACLHSHSENIDTILHEDLPSNRSVATISRRGGSIFLLCQKNGDVRVTFLISTTGCPSTGNRIMFKSPLSKQRF